MQTKFETDNILSQSVFFDNTISLKGHPYLLNKREKEICRITYVPGFSSAIEIIDLEKVLVEIKELENHHGTLMLLTPNPSTDIVRIKDIFSRSPNLKFLSWAARSIAFIECHDHKYDSILSKVKRGNKARIKSNTETFELIKNYDSTFFTIYNMLAGKKNFKEAYVFSPDVFRKLPLRPDIVFRGIKLESRLIAGAFYRIINFNLCPRLDYLFCAKLDGFSSKWTAKLLWEGVNICKNLNLSRYNLGGGVTENDTLWNFKMSFGAKKHHFLRLKYKKA